LIISIPYGAIKREVGMAEKVKTWIFQFLMVRLKAKFLAFVTNSAL